MSVEEAARILTACDALVVAAGAGMGVDSGLPDFRGNEGFWRAYPPMKKLGVSFVEMANPRWFSVDPTLAWGFYGHRASLYRRTEPHAGFAVLREIAARMPHGYFVFTSNVDGAFQKAGFDDDRVLECHGSLGHLQCTRACGQPLYVFDEPPPEVDEETFRAREPLPACPRCGALARPNVLMFGDYGWDGARTEAQEERFGEFLELLRDAKARLAVVECGAGSAVPTVRMTSERLARSFGARLVRVNVREPEVPAGHVGIAGGARETLEHVAALLASGA